MTTRQSGRSPWSESVRDRSRRSARVYERYVGSHLQVSLWIPGYGIKRVSLGHKDRERAKSEARALLLHRPDHSSKGPAPSLGEVLAAYRVYLKYHEDGTEKTASYLSDCKMRERFLLSWLGTDLPATRVRPKRVREYIRARRLGEVSGRAVRTESIRADLVFLNGALKWATTHESGDETPLLERNPLEGFKIPRERNPKQPLLDDRDVEALWRVAPRIHPLLRTVLLLARTTGRRLSSILGLRWSDLDLRRRTIRWRAPLDKARRDWITALPVEVLPALRTLQRKQAAIGDAFLFPSRSDAEKPVSRHAAADWLKRAFRKAGVAKPDGSLWHCLRRNWGTARTGLPMADVLAAGGWGTPEAYLRHYAKATMEGMRQVVDRPTVRADRIASAGLEPASAQRRSS